MLWAVLGIHTILHSCAKPLQKHSVHTPNTLRAVTAPIVAATWRQDTCTAAHCILMLLLLASLKVLAVQSTHHRCKAWQVRAVPMIYIPSADVLQLRL